ncbi:synaptic vesicle glycoprotein 2C isoform 1-T1 [Synchiropus picturatus]
MNSDDREPLLSTGSRDDPELDEGDVIFDLSEHSTEVRRLTFEEALEETGFGVFHFLLLCVCGWANASDAIEVLCISFLLPTARCDLLLSSSDMGLLTASIFLGMMVGGYVWGYMADQRGRRSVLVVSLAVNGLFGGLSSFAPWFWLFLLLRFISGIGVGGSVPVIFSYFSEFMPRHRRGAMISALATFWMAGNIVAAGLAWVVIPRTWAHWSIAGWTFQSWRLFVVLCSVPGLSSALLFRLLMPESPKFLMEVGREKDAIQVFSLMCRMNMGGSGKTFPQKCRLCITEQHETRNNSQTSLGERLKQDFTKGFKPIRHMFRSPLKSRSTVMFIAFYCISFGYYGLWMWFPELFARMEDGGSPCTNVVRPSPQQNQSCYPVKTEVYKESFIMALSNLPGNIFTILLMDSIGGKILLSGSLLVSGLSVFLIYVVKTKVHSLLLSCIFSGVSVIAWNALDVLAPELYPTKLRSSSLGFFTGVGRVAAITANLVFGALVDSDCAVPVLLVSALLLTGGGVAMLLPQTRQTELT